MTTILSKSEKSLGVSFQNVLNCGVLSPSMFLKDRRSLDPNNLDNTKISRPAIHGGIFEKRESFTARYENYGATFSLGKRSMFIYFGQGKYTLFSALLSGKVDRFLTENQEKLFIPLVSGPSSLVSTCFHSFITQFDSFTTRL